MAYSILLADDEPQILKLVKEDLESRGYHVLTASDGQTAIQLATTQRPDLIVLDVAMPMATGLKAFESLRSLPATQVIPVIFMTGVPSAEVYPTVAQGTRVAHIKKPVDVVELASLIQQFLQKYPK